MAITGTWDVNGLSRRRLLAGGAAAAAALAMPLPAHAGGRHGGHGSPKPSPWQPLLTDPDGVVDLPPGFRYRILQSGPTGSTLGNGAPLPGYADGMAAFRGPRGTTILVRNHENEPDQGPPVVGTNPYDPVMHGGTTAVVVDRDRNVVDSYVTSSGSNNNCAGGATPWGTWLTCEEVEGEDGHGYVFEVDPLDPENDRSRTPLTDMGFFSHEACDVDSETGIVYLTEDASAGEIPADPRAETDATRISFLYRYVPTDRRCRRGTLAEGGQLQGLAVDGAEPNPDLWTPGDRFTALRWVELDPAAAHADALAKGCARFVRLEGAFYTDDAFWFADTQGGNARLGQIFRLMIGRHRRPDRLELFFEGSAQSQMELPDNICVAPWGDLVFAEDGPGNNRLRGITPDGVAYDIANNTISEFAGPTFAPDGRTLFVNIQTTPNDGEAGYTLAIWGPFPNADGRCGRRLNAAVPGRGVAPAIRDTTIEAAERAGITPLEAAAYERLAAPLG